MEFLQFKDDLYFIKYKALIMKKFISVLITSILISVAVFAQSTGDYSSVGNGNWNDPTKWETYNGSSWAAASAYPGQNPGTGSVTITNNTEIKITATVPNPVSSLYISAEYARSHENFSSVPLGKLIFSAESAASLTVTTSVGIYGELLIDNQNGAKNHSIIIGGGLLLGDAYGTMGDYGYEEFYTRTIFQTINQDDKLNVTFNTTIPNSMIWGAEFDGVSFQPLTFNGDVTFNGIGIFGGGKINGHANFINGVVGEITFGDGATYSGASAASFVEGRVTKQGNDAFTFPIGGNGIYAPLTISAPVGQTESFSASYRRGDAEGLGIITDPGLLSVSNCEYWNLQPGSTNSNNYSLDVTVGWAAASGCGSPPYINNVSDVTLARFNNTNNSWDSHDGSGIGTTTNGSVTRTGVSAFGYFTLGNLGSCAAPFELNTTNVTPYSATINWSAFPSSVSYDVEYRSVSSSTGIIAASATTSRSVNLTGLYPSTLYYWSVRSNCTSASSAYRSGNFMTLAGPPPVCNDVYETNNTSSQAKTISLGNTISATISSANDIDWFKVTTPNNSNTNLDVRLSNLIADYDLYVYDKNLKLVGSSINSGTLNEVVIYNSNARKATFYIKVLGKNGAFNTSQCYTLLAQAFGGGNRTASHASVPVNELTEDLNKQFLYPNPASEFVYLNFNSAREGLVNIQIVNSIGQLVKQHPVNTIKGYNQFKIQVADIRPGMYILRINKDDLNLTRKFVIAR